MIVYHTIIFIVNLLFYICSDFGQIFFVSSVTGRRRPDQHLLYPGHTLHSVPDHRLQQTFDVKIPQPGNIVILSVYYLWAPEFSSLQMTNGYQNTSSLYHRPLISDPTPPAVNLQRRS